jgi:hypothetical protein
MEITKPIGSGRTDICSGNWSNNLDRMEYGTPPNVASKYQPNGDRQRYR